MSHKQTDSYNETIREGAAQECPKCSEITLSPEPSTVESYIVEWYCECGHFECRVNQEYERKAQEAARTQWWWQQNLDDEWINKQVGEE